MSEVISFTPQEPMNTDFLVSEDAMRLVKNGFPSNIGDFIPNLSEQTATAFEEPADVAAEPVYTTVLERVRTRGRKLAAGLLTTAAFLGTAEVASAVTPTPKGVAKTEYLSAPKDLPAEKLAETRSNDVLEKYDLINPSELLDIDGYNNPGSAVSCMTYFKEIRYRKNVDPGFVFYKKQAAKRGSAAVKASFSLYDLQLWNSSDGFMQSCAWYMKDQSVQTRLYKQQPSGKKILIKQNVAAPSGVGTVRASGLTATLQYPGYTGDPSKRNPTPEKVQQTFFTDKPIKKGDKYSISYTIRGKATDAISNHGHLSKAQKKDLKPIKMSSFNPVKIK